METPHNFKAFILEHAGFTCGALYFKSRITKQNTRFFSARS